MAVGRHSLACGQGQRPAATGSYGLLEANRPLLREDIDQGVRIVQVRVALQDAARSLAPDPLGDHIPDATPSVRRLVDVHHDRSIPETGRHPEGRVAPRSHISMTSLRAAPGEAARQGELEAFARLAEADAA